MKKIFPLLIIGFVLSACTIAPTLTSSRMIFVPEGTRHTLTTVTPVALPIPETIINFQIAQPFGEPDPRYFTLIYQNKKTVVSWDIENLSLQQEGKVIDMELPKGFYIFNMYYTEYNDDLILAFVARTDETAGGFAARIEKNKTKPSWVSPMRGFNVGEPVIRGEYVYVTAIGFVGKIDLQSGQYAWKYNNMYSYSPTGENFNAFSKPEFKDESVLFQEIPSTNRFPKHIEINDRTGRIIKTYP